MTMPLTSGNPVAVGIQGQLLRLSERREVAIYLRHDRLWVADFIDGRGELIDALTWFRFNCGTHAHARRRMVLESAIPLSAQIVARIEHLHGSPDVRSRGKVARLSSAFAHVCRTAWRCWSEDTSPIVAAASAIPRTEAEPLRLAQPIQAGATPATASENKAGLHNPRITEAAAMDASRTPA